MNIWLCSKYLGESNGCGNIKNNNHKKNETAMGNHSVFKHLQQFVKQKKSLRVSDKCLHSTKCSSDPRQWHKEHRASNTPPVCSPRINGAGPKRRAGLHIIH